MKVLQVNKYLYRRGGAEAYMLDLADLQGAAADDVEFFAMAHPEDPPSRFGSYFPRYVELNPPPAGIVGRFSAAGRMIWSPSARRGLDRVLDEFQPDVVHLHNIYSQLSPSILRAADARGIPMVMTLHDYKLACPTYRFLAGDEICEACLGGKYHHAVLKRCNRGSLSFSMLSAIENTIHDRFRSYSPVDRFICPSGFLRDKMTAAGVHIDKLRHVPHFVDATGIQPKQEPGGPIAFAGRLSPEKGIDVLIKAVALEPSLSLVVAGDGPDREHLERMAERMAPGRVRFVGRLSRDDTLALMRASTAVAVPSTWYENQPIVILEAFASGVPVVGTDLGGLPELIHPGETGELVEPADASALGQTLASLVADPIRAFESGRVARRFVEAEFSPEFHLERVRAVYGEASHHRRTDPQKLRS